MIQWNLSQLNKSKGNLMNAEEAILHIEKWLQDVEGVGIGWLHLQANFTDEKDNEAMKFINKLIDKNQKVEQL